MNTNTGTADVDTVINAPAADDQAADATTIKSPDKPILELERGYYS